MASSSTKHSYLLPGERNPSLPIVHHHGNYKTIQSSSYSKQSDENTFIFISRIYKPNKNDFVFGIVLFRLQDLFLVDINSSEPAILPTTSFDDSRVPSREKMNRLRIVYARIVNTDSWAQTELSCQTYEHSKKKTTFGVFEEGNILRCSLELCKKLQQSQLIGHFNRIVKGFRIRIARNGFIWYRADDINSMIAVKNVLYQYELENDADRLIDLYKSIITKLEQQDQSLMEFKAQKIIEKNIETKQINQ